MLGLDWGLACEDVSVEARLLGATLGEGWAVMGDLLTGLSPGLIVVDGEKGLSALAAELAHQSIQPGPSMPCQPPLSSRHQRAEAFSFRTPRPVVCEVE